MEVKSRRNHGSIRSSSDQRHLAAEFVNEFTVLQFWNSRTEIFLDELPK